MLDWWNALTLFQQIMVCIGAPATLLIVIQLVLIIVGFNTDDSFDTAGDADTDVSDMSMDIANHEGFLSIGGMKILTLRGVLAFLSVGGWLTMALCYTMPPVWASLIGIAAGALTAFLIAFAFHSAMKLQSSGNIDYANAVSHSATVYIKIPGKRSGKGKVTMTIQERFSEIDAVTEDEKPIETGAAVNVTGLADENTVIVSRLK